MSYSELPVFRRILVQGSLVVDRKDDICDIAFDVLSPRTPWQSRRAHDDVDYLSKDTPMYGRFGPLIRIVSQVKLVIRWTSFDCREEEFVSKIRARIWLCHDLHVKEEEGTEGVLWWRYIYIGERGACMLLKQVIVERGTEQRLLVIATRR